MYTELLSPLYGTWNGLPVIAVGAIPDDGVRYIIVADDGVMHSIPFSELKVDVRFDDGRWHDVSPDSVTVEDG